MSLKNSSSSSSSYFSQRARRRRSKTFFRAPSFDAIIRRHQRLPPSFLRDDSSKPSLASSAIAPRETRAPYPTRRFDARGVVEDTRRLPTLFPPLRRVSACVPSSTVHHHRSVLLCKRRRPLDISARGKRIRKEDGRTPLISTTTTKRRRRRKKNSTESARRRARRRYLRSSGRRLFP